MNLYGFVGNDGVGDFDMLGRAAYGVIIARPLDFLGGDKINPNSHTAKTYNRVDRQIKVYLEMIKEDIATVTAMSDEKWDEEVKTITVSFDGKTEEMSGTGMRGTVLGWLREEEKSQVILQDTGSDKRFDEIVAGLPGMGLPPEGEERTAPTYKYSDYFIAQHTGDAWPDKAGSGKGGYNLVPFPDLWELTQCDQEGAFCNEDLTDVSYAFSLSGKPKCVLDFVPMQVSTKILQNGRPDRFRNGPPPGAKTK